MGQIEILTVEEFADRMKFSRTTVFDWIKRGTLKAGRHYIKMGRIIRFEWGPELIKKLHDDSSVEEVVLSDVKPKPPTVKKTRTAAKGGTVLNFDY